MCAVAVWAARAAGRPIRTVEYLLNPKPTMNDLRTPSGTSDMPMTIYSPIADSNSIILMNKQAFDSVHLYTSTRVLIYEIL